MKDKFIKTSDEGTAIMLRNAGLVELNKEGNKWVFVNDADKMQFSINDLKGVQKTNILHF